MPNRSPIGIFDSGLGGLTVFKEIRKILPGEDLIYFGDTARVPYGNKSKETIIKYSKEISGFLIRKGVKIIVIACNTSSSLAMDDLRREVKIPVFGVIEPGAKKAATVSSGRTIAVIGTQATIKSTAYSRAILQEFKNRGLAFGKVIEKSCPLLVPIVEEGLGLGTGNGFGRDIAKRIVSYYLDPVKQENPYCLVLGCTHYPIIKDLIEGVVGKGMEIIDSGVEAALFIKNFLEKENMLKEGEVSGINQFFVSDDPGRFVELGGKFLNMNIENIGIISDFT